MRQTLLALAGALTFATALAGAAQAAPAANDYADPATWLCLPGRTADACAADQTATLVAADGTLTIQPFRRAADPAIDCFYVYPTVSNDKTPNSDMTANAEELSVIAVQFARFGQIGLDRHQCCLLRRTLEPQGQRRARIGVQLQMRRAQGDGSHHPRSGRAPLAGKLPKCLAHVTLGHLTKCEL
jgi:hypothetical protein